MRIDQLPVASEATNLNTMPLNVDGVTEQISVGNLSNAIRDDVYGAPLTASTSAGMTDQTKVYVYTGTTGGGYTNGHWYYYNGSAWTDGGVYNSSAVQTDTTLTLSGVPADAKATGDAINDIGDLFDSITAKTQILDSAIMSTNNNGAITNNNDGSYTVGTTDYGNTTFGSKLTLSPGGYLLFGVPNGVSFLSTTSSASTTYNNRVFDNDTEQPKLFYTATAQDLYVGFRSTSRPSASYTIYPALYKISYTPNIMLPCGDIPSNSDLDDYMTIGVFAVRSMAVAESLEHWPIYGKTSGRSVAGMLEITSAHYNTTELGIVQKAFSEDQMWTRFWNGSTWSTWFLNYNSVYADVEPTYNSTSVAQSGGTFNLINGQGCRYIIPEFVKMWGHLFIDGIGESANPIIPSESIYEIAISSRLGFKIIEGHFHKTSDNKYIVMHGENGNIGYELVKVSDGSYDASTAINSKTLSELQSDYKYKSQYTKYQTSVCSADEWLLAVKNAGMIPLVFCTDQSGVDLIRKYFRDDFILYANERFGHRGYALKYQYSLGQTLAAAKTTVDGIIEAYGVPTIINTFDIDSFTDADLAELTQYVHGKGALFGTANCYYNSKVSRIIKAQKAGVDIVSSAWEIPDFENGNIINAIGDFSFDDFVHTGTVSNNTIALGNTQTITLPTQQVKQLAKGILKIRYSGRITVEMGDYFYYSTTSGAYESDGAIEQVFSTYYMNASPTFTITSLGNTTIHSISFKASIC